MVWEDRGTSLLHFSYWINLFVSLISSLFLGTQDLFGLYNPPSSSPVPIPPGVIPGLWEGPYPTPIIGAGVVNIPSFDDDSNRVMIFSAYARDKFSQPDVMDFGRTRTAVLDLDTHTILADVLVSSTDHDMFCPGTAFLEDGRTVMVTGGSTTRRMSLFDTETLEWTRGPDMLVPRGYHSMTVLGDGSVFSFGGSWSGGVGNKDGEVWDPDSDSWKLYPGVEAKGDIVTRDSTGVEKGDNHMWLFTAPNSDKIFHAGPSSMMHWLSVDGRGDTIPAGRRDDTDKMCGNAVMYDIGKILVIGGSPNQDSGDAYRDAFVIDINNGENVSVERVGDMIHPRVFASATVLPNGQVFVAGGQTRARKFNDAGGVAQAEMFDPQTKVFTPLASMDTIRVYHSSCILMKDGRVVCTGGGLCVDWQPLPCNNHYDYEIYTPPYLLNSDSSLATRPSILSGSSTVNLGGLLDIQTDVPCTFAMVRLGAVTHMINNDNRRVPLAVDTVTISSGGYAYDLSVPDNNRVVLPGVYWLYAMNEADGVPSIGWNVHVVV